MVMKYLLDHNGLWGLLAIALFAAGITALYQSPAESAGWRLNGEFDHVGDLKVGNDVLLAGFSVGTVEAITLQPDLKVRVTMHLEDGLEIPDDSDVRIQTTGLFSTPNLALMPGGGFDLLEDGDQIAFTQSSVDFIALFEQIVTAGGEQGTPS